MSFINEFEHLRIQLDAIKMATNNFGDDNYVGKGGFGKVYKGKLEGRAMVAVKRLDRALHQGGHEFWKEIMMLSIYKHENLISLLGFCDESGEKILVYEYASNKSLDLYLSNPDLTCIQRLKICIGAARGLEYLHNPGGTEQRVLHRDIKSSNILLDENWEAKISDFGLSKFGPDNKQFTFLFSNVVGTFGYCDPLYMETGLLTKESDVYSFGVVLFEVMCGRLCIINYNDDRRFLPKLAKKCYEEKKLSTIIDDSLQDQMVPDCVDTFSAIAYQCLRTNRRERPSVTEIVKQLEVALEYQISSVAKPLSGVPTCRKHVNAPDPATPEPLDMPPSTVPFSGLQVWSSTNTTSLKSLNWINPKWGLWGDSPNPGKNETRALEIDIPELESLFSAASTSDRTDTSGAPKGSK